ncbi:MAG: hypothetical protein ACXABD_11160, partial [Candidatus Thorarchaeota archaeon]
MADAPSWIVTLKIQRADERKSKMPAWLAELTSFVEEVDDNTADLHKTKAEGGVEAKLRDSI